MLSSVQQEWIEHQKCLAQFCIDARCWDGIDHEALTSWLGNFPDDEGRYYALRLLHRFIYYSEHDTVQLCRYGLFDLVLGLDLLQSQVASDFSRSSEALEGLLQLALATSRIVPILDKDKPYESGNLVTRILVQKLGVPTSVIVSPDKIATELKSGQCNRIVLIDDCIGSCDQLSGFWNKPRLQVGQGSVSPRALAVDFPSVHFDYLTLVATEGGLETAATATPGLRVVACEVLTDEHRVFRSGSNFFCSDAEMCSAIAYLANLLEDKGIDLTGYRGLDHAVAFHHNIPDWSLPLFHKRRPTWRPLILRKDSDE